MPKPALHASRTPHRSCRIDSALVTRRDKTSPERPLAVPSRAAVHRRLDLGTPWHHRFPRFWRFSTLHGCPNVTGSCVPRVAKRSSATTGSL